MVHTYNMSKRDLPDIYVLGPAALGLGHVIPLANVITTVLAQTFEGFKFSWILWSLTIYEKIGLES